MTEVEREIKERQESDLQSSGWQQVNELMWQSPRTEVVLPRYAAHAAEMDYRMALERSVSSAIKSDQEIWLRAYCAALQSSSDKINLIPGVKAQMAVLAFKAQFNVK